MVQTADQWLALMPPVTRAYFVLAVLTTVGCSLEVINGFQIYFNWTMIRRGQVWRLLTCFLYFGNVGIEFIFQMFLMVRYCKALEEGSFRNRSADFLWMLLLGGSALVGAAPFFSVLFLGQALTFMVVYVWARRNQHVRMSLFGVFNFTAPYLPWVLIGFSMVLGHDPTDDILGVVAGHVYYYLEDVFPRISGGARVLRTPWLLRAAFGEARGVGGAPSITVEHAPLEVPPAPGAPGPDEMAPAGQRREDAHAHVD